jgi:hypothetical protein
MFGQHIMVCTCQSAMCHLTLTSFSWCTDFVKFVSSFHDKVSFFITIQSSFTILGPHIYHGGYTSVRHVSPVSSYINLFSEKYFTQIICRGQRDIDLSTLVSCFNTNLLFPVYNLMYIKGCYFDNDKYTIGVFLLRKLISWKIASITCFLKSGRLPISFVS